MSKIAMQYILCYSSRNVNRAEFSERKVGTESDKIEEIEHRELDLPYAKKILFHSFNFSQGDSELQREIFRYLHNIHPEWKMTDRMTMNLRKEFEELAKKYLLYDPTAQDHPHKTMMAAANSDKILSTVAQEAYNLQAELSGKKELTDNQKQTLIHSLFQNIMARDYRFLIKNNGRPRKESDSSNVSPRTDPYLSHLIYYGIEGHTTGIPEYDHMFKDILTDIRKSISPDDRDMLNQIIRVYNEKHPEANIDLDKFLSQEKTSF